MNGRLGPVAVRPLGRNAPKVDIAVAAKHQFCDVVNFGKKTLALIGIFATVPN
jgi:hypothetical protein